ncbi:MAG: phospholipase D-like domain-containing protein, partial [Burkholderiaceae bacterium]
DNAVALMGGRNIGDQYFQIDPDSQFADDDLFTVGPISQQLSATFDEFWNNGLSIPVDALYSDKRSKEALNVHRINLHDELTQMKEEGVGYLKRVATGEPFNGIISGRLPLVWAHAELVCDSPDKKKVESGEMVGRLMKREVAKATIAVQSELLMVSPYLVPGKEGMQIFKDLRKRNVRVRIITNSLESQTVLPAQAAYMNYRKAFLEDGIEVYEIRSLLGNTKGSGQTAEISRFGNYSLHGKLFVMDRKRLFIGSMNFDQRSMVLNTEIGVIIDSPELAQQVAARFEAMAQPANSYLVALRPDAEGNLNLVWRTKEGGKDVEYDKEPARSDWQRIEAHLFMLLPLEREL